MSQTPPIDKHLLEFKFPEVRETRLDNGLTLLVIERHDIPKVYFHLGFEFGEKFDPCDKQGTMEMLGRLLKKGTAKRSYRQITEEVDFVGGILDTAVSNDFLYVYGQFLREHSEAGLALMGDIVSNPVFSAEELEKERQKMLTDLENEKSSPSFLARRHLYIALYDPHPYAFYKSAQSISRIDRRTLQELYYRHGSPAKACLVIAGDITFDQALEQSQRYFSNWRGGEDFSQTFPALREAQQRQVFLIDRPGSEQVNLLLGNLLFNRRHPAYPKALVSNKILGDGASGRLFMSLRETKGYTYGAYSSLEVMKEHGAWIANAEVRPEVADKAISALFEEFHKIQNDPLAPEELTGAKRYLIGNFPLKNESLPAIAALLLLQKLYGFPGDYWSQYLAEIDAVTIEDVQHTTRTFIRPESMAVVVVGEAKELASQLQPLGNVTLLDLEGQPVRKPR